MLVGVIVKYRQLHKLSVLKVYMMNFPRKENGRLDLVAYNRAKQSEQKEMASWIDRHGSKSEKFQFQRFCENMKQGALKTEEINRKLATHEETLDKKGPKKSRKNGGCNIQ